MSVCIMIRELSHRFLKYECCEPNERKQLITLTAEGEILKERAVDGSHVMTGCIDLPEHELLTLKTLLIKAMRSMEYK